MLIGLSGKMKTGKTTAALWMQADHGCSRRSFAAVLREYVGRMFGATEKQLADGDFKESVSGIAGLTWRELMIKTGAFLRSLDENFLVDRLDWSGKNIVIDDVRFQNEARKIKAAGGVIIRLFRPQAPTINDISETDMDNWPFDYTVDNAGDHQQLYNQLDDIMAGLKGRDSGS